MNTNNSQSYSLRTGVESDIPSAIGIWRSSIESTSNQKLCPSVIERQELILSKLADSNSVGQFWVAERSDEVIGWQSLSPTDWNDSLFGNANVMSSTYVKRRAGDRNLGSSLLDTAIQYARMSNISVIFGYISADNVASQRLAKLHGFKLLGTFPVIPGWSDKEPLQYWYLPTVSNTIE